jgi:hypothetical protein
MKLQSQNGSCFASATHLGYGIAYSRHIRRTGEVPEEGSDDIVRIRHNAKILAVRLISQLRRAGLVTTKRRVRRDGTQGTNVVDFSALWSVIYPLLRRMMQSRYWEGARRIFNRARQSVLLLKVTDQLASYYAELPFKIPPLPPLVDRGVKPNSNLGEATPEKQSNSILTRSKHINQRVMAGS